MVFREKLGRDRAKGTLSLEQTPEPRVLPDPPESPEESRLECLRACLSQLPSDSRDLILSYYQGEKGEKIKNRKALTDLFGIPANILRMRALRVRERLQVCADGCLQRKQRIAL